MNAEAQLSVTAPTRINYVLESDGTFTCPDAAAVSVETTPLYSKTSPSRQSRGPPT